MQLEHRLIRQVRTTTPPAPPRNPVPDRTPGPARSRDDEPVRMTALP